MKNVKRVLMELSARFREIDRSDVKTVHNKPIKPGWIIEIGDSIQFYSTSNGKKEVVKGEVKKVVGDKIQVWED